MKTRMTGLAAALTAAFIGTVNAQDMSAPRQMAGTDLATNTDLPAPSSRVPFEPLSVLGKAPANVEIIKRTALTIYNTGTPSGRMALVVQDDITGRVCVQQFSKVADEILPFICTDAGPGPAMDIAKAAKVVASNPGINQIAGDGNLIEIATMSNNTISRHLQFQVAYIWSLKSPEVCVNLIQRYPNVEVTEMGCASITQRQLVDKFSGDNKPSFNI